MGCVFSNTRLGHEIAAPRAIAARAIAAVGTAAGAAARDRWERELAAWLGAYARALLAGAPGFDVGDLAWTPDHFAAQQQFVVGAAAEAAAVEPAEVALVVDRIAGLIARHRPAWVVVGRRWPWGDLQVVSPD